MLNLRKFVTLAQISKPNHSSEHDPHKAKMLRVVTWHLFFFGDLSESEKLSENKPPLDMIYSLKQLRGRSPRHRKKKRIFFLQKFDAYRSELSSGKYRKFCTPQRDFTTRSEFLWLFRGAAVTLCMVGKRLCSKIIFCSFTSRHKASSLTFHYYY